MTGIHFLTTKTEGMQESAACKEPAMASLHSTGVFLKLPGNTKTQTIGRAMKLTAFFLLVACLHVSAKGITQENITLSVKDASLLTVLKAIEKQSDYTYILDNKWLDKAKKITFTANNQPVLRVLDLCFKDQPLLTYSLSGKVIIVTPKELKAQQSTATSAALPADLRGRVVNENGDPVQGVTVTIKGTKISTTTNENGEFLLSTVNRDATLVFTHVSLETFELNASGKAELAITLKTKVSALGDITVSVNTGYEKIPKERATGSFVTINNEQLNRQIGTDFLSRLEGVANSLYFDRRGISPTAKISPENITIRGLSTLTNAIKSPLIVVNNFPYDGDFNNINPNDIESISILKDAAAASIWGARAGNGVIVITTKKGQFNQPTRLTVNTNVNIIEKPDLFKFPAMSTSDFIDVEKYLFDQGFYDNDLSDPYYPALSPVVELLDQVRNGVISQDEANSKIDLLRAKDLRKDYSKYIYRRSVNQQYALNLSGGSDKIKYALSGGFDRGTQSLVGNQDTRTTLRFGTSITPVKKLELQTELAYTNANSKFNGIGDYGNSSLDYYYQSRKIYPYAEMADPTGKPLALAHYYRTGYIDSAGAGKLMDWNYRPLDELNSTDNSLKSTDWTANLVGIYKLLRGLNFQVSYQYEQTNGVRSSYYNTNSFFARNLINSFSQLQNGTVTYVIPKAGILDKSTSSLISQSGRAQINYNNTWSKNQLNLLGGWEIKERVLSTDTRRFYGYNSSTLSSSSLDYVNLYPQYGDRGLSTIVDPSGLTKITDNFVSAFANAAYTFNNRYILSGSFRRDASNLLGVNANNKWKPFWTLGASWNISDENFYKIKAISYLRLRTSYGYQGNVNNTLAPYPILSYNSGSSTVTNQPFATISVPANPDLSWEEVKQLNIGADFKAFSNRVEGSIEYYRKNSTNLILGSALDPTTGLNGVARNSANLLTNGIDLSLGISPIQKGFQWKIEVGFSLVNSKVKDYLVNDKNRNLQSFESFGLSIRPVKGKSPYAIYSFPFAGLDPTTGNPMGYLGKTTSTNYFALANQLYDTANFIYNGSAVPTKFGFFNNAFSYKGVSLLVGISYQLGYYFRKKTISYFALYNFGETNLDFDKRWKTPGDEKNTNIPSMIYPVNSAYRDEFFQYSDVNVLKGDHIRFQYVRVGYNFSGNGLRKAGFRDIQLYGVINNLGIIWRANKEGLDPTYNVGTGYFPPPKSYSLGVKFTL